MTYEFTTSKVYCTLWVPIILFQNLYITMNKIHSNSSELFTVSTTHGRIIVIVYNIFSTKGLGNILISPIIFREYSLPPGIFPGEYFQCLITKNNQTVLTKKW